MEKRCKCGEVLDREGRLCTKCLKPRSSYPLPHRLCEECGENYKGRTRKFCTPFCRNTSNNKAKILRAGSKVASEKKCNKCYSTLPSWMFNVDLTKIDGLSSSGCRKCQAEKHKAWRKVNPDKIRNANLTKKYGITVEEYEYFLQAQDGKCALCGKEPTGKRLAVDHDHNTGEVRALLCSFCNKHKVGNLTLDDVTRIKRYLENPPVRQFQGGIPRYVPEGMKNPPKYRRKKRAVSRRRVN